ncbi:Serine/threonine-protein phosphatase 4 catalytic subunit 1 [Dictyocoela roeselum]|nr:Serine/threonine-protein phosphatase 4 catalytic subunit 1 [Dictyocoela roeselum]
MNFFQNCLVKIINHQKLKKADVAKIIDEIKFIFLNESQILFVESPCYVLGDIHGQFYDLLNAFTKIKSHVTEQLLDKSGVVKTKCQNKDMGSKNQFVSFKKRKTKYPENNEESYYKEQAEKNCKKRESDLFISHISDDIACNNYMMECEYQQIMNKYISPTANIICLGDYVDRGYNSIECVIFLFLYKIIFKRIYLLKGNHESKLVNGVYGFRSECLEKYDEYVFVKFMDVFELMSICCVVDNRYFLVHGGIGKIDYQKIYSKDAKFAPACKKNDDENVFANPITDKKMDLLRNYFTTDVPEKYSDFLWSDPGTEGLIKNSRGLGYLFGLDAVEKFLDLFGLECIIRSHQLVYEGYKSDFDGKVITIWSAPNYCYRMGNLASILVINKGMDFIVFNKVDKQY